MGTRCWEYPSAHKKEAADEGISKQAKQPLPQNRISKIANDSWKLKMEDFQGPWTEAQGLKLK